MPPLTLAICAGATALSPLKVCHHKTCSKNGLAKKTLDIAHVLGGPEAAVPTAACQSGCNAGTVSVVGRRLYDVEKASAATRSIKALDRRLADIETGAFSVRTGVVERRQELEAAEGEEELIRHFS